MTPSVVTTQLLTDRDVAALTGLARSTLAKLRLTGEGPPFVKLGAAVRYRVDDVEAWLTAKPRQRSTSDTCQVAQGEKSKSHKHVTHTAA